MLYYWLIAMVTKVDISSDNLKEQNIQAITDLTPNTLVLKPFTKVLRLSK